MAHAYEIVHTSFRDWKFQAADTIAAFGLHGVLIVGTPRYVRTAAGLNRDLVKELKGFKVSLFCNGELRDSGAGTNVLGSPLLALSHLVEVLATLPQHKPLREGEIITTGTLTAALPIKAGETWTTAFTGLDLPGLSVRFT
jgi:2-oxo-3-hexenedioate decarboxylase